MRVALQWFYDTSPRENSNQEDESLVTLTKIFTNGCQELEKSLQTSSAQVENPSLSKEDSDSESYSIFCAKNPASG